MSDITIKSIVASRKKGYCFINYSDGSYTLCSVDIVYEYSLKKGITVDSDYRKKIEERQEIFTIKQVALNYATYATRSEYQVRNKLKIKGYHSGSIEMAIAFLKEFGYLSDDKFCEEFIKAKTSRRYYGYERLRRELKGKGITDDLITKSINLWYPHNELETIALKSAEKKLRSISFREKVKQKHQVKNHLIVQGFNYDIVQKVCKSLFKD